MYSNIGDSICYENIRLVIGRGIELCEGEAKLYNTESRFHGPVANISGNFGSQVNFETSGCFISDFLIFK